MLRFYLLYTRNENEENYLPAHGLPAGQSSWPVPRDCIHPGSATFRMPSPARAAGTW